MKSRPRAPSLVDRYAIHDAIGSGGMAQVHFARLSAAAGFSRIVAVKRLHSQFVADPEFVAMFVDEARLAARVRHPNVVPTLDVVSTSGELLIVMEYVEGESLSRLLATAARRGEPVPLPIASAVVSGALHGLHAAHEASSERGEPLGIVHRDVSPQNLLVGADGVVRVLDFGVAKAVGRMQSTRDGQLKGKIAYMAPEQVRGGSVTRQADVYAAAVVLWETICGRRMYFAENDVALLQQVLTKPIDPPSRHRAELPPTLERIVLCGAESDPTKRYATANQMARELEATVPPALASEVGAWVRALAGEALAKRAERVASIESEPVDRAAGPAGEPQRESPAADTIPAPPLETPGEAVQPILQTAISTSAGVASSAARTEHPRKKAWVRLGLVSAVGLGAVALGVRVFAPASPVALPSAAGTTAATSAPIAASVAPTASQIASAAPPPADSSASSAAPAPVRARPLATPAATPTTPATRTPKATPPAPSKSLRFTEPD